MRQCCEEQAKLNSNTYINTFFEQKIFFLKKKKIKMAGSKKLIVQLRQFSIFFHENFMDWIFWFIHFDFLFFKNKGKVCFISMKTSSPFIWDITYFCTMHGFFRILEKTSSELICTRLYSLIQEETLILDTKINSKSEEKI